MVLQKYHLVRIYGNKSKIRNKHNFNHFLTNLRYFSAILMERQITQIFMAFQHKKCFQNLNPKSKFSLILNIFDEDQKPILRVSSRSVAVDRRFNNQPRCDRPIEFIFATQLIAVLFYTMPVVNDWVMSRP